jgi:putative toxin-antitoxin system antitoxin component (TIGR02293 family)
LRHMTEYASLDDPSVGRAPADVRRYWRLTREGHAGANRHVTLLGMKSVETAELLERVRRGFIFTAFERLGKNIDLAPRELAFIMQIPLRTLDRRKERGRLEPAESDRLLRVSRVFAAAIELFEGDADAARRWVSRKQNALGNRKPLDLLRTELGAREVEAFIGRLEHGVFS